VQLSFQAVFDKGQNETAIDSEQNNTDDTGMGTEKVVTEVTMGQAKSQKWRNFFP
jgi:hypothetical protein